MQYIPFSFAKIFVCVLLYIWRNFMFSKVLSFGLIGLKGYKIDVEVDTNQGKPSFDIVG